MSFLYSSTRFMSFIIIALEQIGIVPVIETPCHFIEVGLQMFERILCHVPMMPRFNSEKADSIPFVVMIKAVLIAGVLLSW